MSTVTAATPGGIYWTPIDSDEPWRPLGTLSSGIVLAPPDTPVDLSRLLYGGTITTTVQMDPEAWRLMWRWFREMRRREVAQRRIAQQMRHVRQRAARRARRAA